MREKAKEEQKEERELAAMGTNDPLFNEDSVASMVTSDPKGGLFLEEIEAQLEQEGIVNDEGYAPNTPAKSPLELPATPRGSPTKRTHEVEAQDEHEAKTARMDATKSKRFKIFRKPTSR